MLIAELAGVGRDYPLSIEKLCPVLSFYVVSDWKEGCERCKQILRYGGMGHTMSIHSRNEDVILEFGLKKPAYRIVVNTPTTLGSIGFTTSLDPSMTLGCGGWGGNITSDNISPKHLLNIKRLAWETSPAPVAARCGAAGHRRELKGAGPAANRGCRGAGGHSSGVARSPDRSVSGVARLCGHRAPSPRKGSPRQSRKLPPGEAPRQPPADDRVEKAADFVCEEDVRLAVRQGRKIVIGERTIVTPAARDLGEQHRVFVEAAGVP